MTQLNRHVNKQETQKKLKPVFRIALKIVCVFVLLTVVGIGILLFFLGMTPLEFTIESVCRNESDCKDYANEFIKTNDNLSVLDYLRSRQIDWVRCDEWACEVGYYDWSKDNLSGENMVLDPTKEEYSDKIFALYKDGWEIDPSGTGVSVSITKKVIKRFPNRFLCTDNYSEVIIDYTKMDLSETYDKLDAPYYFYQFYEDGCDGDGFF